MAGLILVQFSIITPSFRNGEWLKLCIASVADQTVDREHIVQDAGSDDGTLDWLRQDRRVQTFVEPDQGMYDAINRGFARAQGEILAYLNCDEQYLPGTLDAVAEFFKKNSSVDVLFANVVIVGPEGEYLCHRKIQPPLKYHTWTCHLSSLSCATFIRRRVIFDYQLHFDPGWRAAGDGEWMIRVLQRGVKMASLDQFTSAFTATGANLGLKQNAVDENRRLRLTAPRWAQLGRPAIVLWHRLRRLLHGSYKQSAFDYRIFTRQSPQQRVLFQVQHPTVRCPKGYEP